jgi:beta-1,4-mannosyltransferase
VRALFFWEPVGGLSLSDPCNPYAGLLELELKKLGIDLELGDYGFEKSWLEAKRDTCDVLHLHWLHFFYRLDTMESSLARCARFTENLAYARELGYRVVWTLHNLYPHERPYPDIDRIARQAVCEAADHVIAHCDFGVRAAARFFHRTTDISVISHGHFIDVFPNETSTAEARDRLGIPKDAFVYLYFGNARAYKGIESLIEAFTQIDDEKARLVLMMRNEFDPAYADTVIARAGGDERVLVYTSSFFPEEDFQFYLNTGDIGVFPFSDVMTSGSTISGLGFGLPAIVPRLGCLTELIDDSCGLTYDAADPEGLAGALRAVRDLDIDALKRGARARAESLDWKMIARKTAEVYTGRVASP